MIIYNMYQYKYYVYTIVKYIHIHIIVIGRVCPILMAILAWYPSHYHTIFIVFHENENKYCIIIDDKLCQALITMVYSYGHHREICSVV